MSLLSVQSLKVWFPVKNGLLSREKRFVRAVDDVSFEIAHGETLGLVGESGCGKTTLSRAILRLVTPTAGRILFNNADLAKLSGSDLRKRRREIQMIFQDPYRSLNPRMNVEGIVGEALDIHRLAPTTQTRRARILELLEQVGLDESHLTRYPHEFSGGQRQRIGIARALAVEPNLIVCDEPVSALDVSVQAQIINLLQDLQKTKRIAYLFVAHDLAVVEHISHRIMVMYLGKVMEIGPAARVCRAPKHPYTRALIAAVPSIGKSKPPAADLLQGDPPSPINPPSGCPFHPRCPIAVELCKNQMPPLKTHDADVSVACHLA
jgi:oligopeptide/dipeptide ABC transporter ATP-binding protein